MAETDEHDRAQEVLESWFAAQEEGRDADLAALCGDDRELFERLRPLVETDPLGTGLLARVVPPAHDDDLPAERLGEFRLLSRLGAGGMGQVFLAEQESLNRLVAVKMLDERALRDPHAKLRFRREAEITAALDHPNIVPIYGLGDDEGVSFIAMKWLSGPGLDALAAPLSPRETARVGIAIARALEEAHLSGVIHRDLKPGNVIFDADVPFLVDFGLARSYGDLTLTREGVVPGTLPYMAPEQLGSRTKTADPRTDVYGLGATLYEALTGEPPFEPAEPERLVRSILLRDPTPPRLAHHERDLGTIILRCLEKDADLRFQSAAELADDLDRFLRGDAIQTRPVGAVTRAWRLARRHRGVATTIGGLGLASSGLLVWVLLGIAEDRRVMAEGLRSFDDLIARRRFMTAAAVLERLDEGHRDDARVTSRREDVAAHLALEDLFDQVQDRSSSQNPARLATIMAEVERTRAIARSPRYARLALACLELHLRAPERAERWLVEVETGGRETGGAGRATRAFRELLAGAVPTAGTDDSTVADPDEHVFTAVALQLARSPEVEQAAELERALERDERHERTLFGLAALDSERGHHEAALAGFRALLRVDRPHPAIRRHIARSLLILGDLAGAQAQLDRLQPDEEGPLTALVRSEILRRRGRDAEARTLVFEAHDRWGDDSDILTRMAFWREREGDRAAARTLLRKAVENATHAGHRERAESDLLTLDCAEAMTTGGEALQEILRQTRDFRARARSSEAEARAMTLEGAILTATGARPTGFDLLLRAARLAPDDCMSRHQVVAFVTNGLARREFPSNILTAYWTSMALQCARELVKLEERGVVAPPRAYIDEAWYALVYLLEQVKRRDEAAEAARAAWDRFADREGESPELDDLLDYLERVMESD